MNSDDARTAGPLERLVGFQPSCKSCAHTRCIFSGESRVPVYGSGVIRRNGYKSIDGSCWIDPASDFGRSLLQANAGAKAPPAERSVI